jgi:uncharacterized protein (TIGR00369 family)
MMERAEAEWLLARCELHALLGLELVEWEEGRVAFRFVPPALARAGEGTPLHGGALAATLDTAATFAVISSIGQDASTVDLRVDFLRPGLDPELRVEGRTTRAGRRFAFADAAVTAADGRLVASGRGTFTW